ncbi:VOC family protein [Streptomyces sp. NPDC087908]|uniref:VOC family protein n=1 Tax=unclassified Streptomyces TaxID=2593676 RepID=UPI0021C93DA2|nr:VOC family protein [Streptomyces sp. adm13(2018)]
MTLHAYLSFDDAPAGMRWLERLGFETVARQADDNGRIIHAELRLGQAVVLLATSQAAYDVPALKGDSTGGGVYLAAQNVDDLYNRAVQAGGRSVLAPEDTAWGSRRARVLDPEGHEWSFGSYAPGRRGNDEE